MTAVSGDAAIAPQLTSGQFARLTAYGVAQEVRSGRPANSRIEIPSGFSGHNLTQRAAWRGLTCGARLSSLLRRHALDTTAERIRVDLAGGTRSRRAVLMATGVRPDAASARQAEFESEVIYFAATETPEPAVPGPGTVVGRANSAGPAELYLAAEGSPAILAIRGQVAPRSHEAGFRRDRYIRADVQLGPRNSA